MAIRSQVPMDQRQSDAGGRVLIICSDLFFSTQVANMVRQAGFDAVLEMQSQARPFHREQLPRQERIAQLYAPEFVHEQRADNEALLRREFAAVAQRARYRAEGVDEREIFGRNVSETPALVYDVLERAA